MEESDECRCAGEIQCLHMGAGGDWSGDRLWVCQGEHRCGGRGRGRRDVDSPETGAGGFTLPREDGIPLFVFDFQDVLIQVGRAVIVTELSEAEEIVGKARNDVAGACTDRGKGWYGQDMDVLNSPVAVRMVVVRAVVSTWRRGALSVK